MKNWFKRKKVLVYDISLIPENETIETVIERFKKDGVVLFNALKKTEDNEYVGKYTTAPKVIEL